MDIVATQGECLVPRWHTPVWEKEYSEEFAVILTRKLDALDIAQLVRRAKYGPAADEWPIGHTPPEMKERRVAELRALEELEDRTSDEDSDEYESHDTTADNRAAGSKETQPAPGPAASRTHPREVGWLPTPPLSEQRSILKLRGRERRRLSAGNEEAERPRKTRATSTTTGESSTEEKPHGSPGRVQKRQRTDDADDDAEEHHERPTKAPRPTSAGVPYGG